MKTLTVEVTEEEYKKLVLLQRADVELSHHTVERYLGLTLSAGGRIRWGALQFEEFVDLDKYLSVPPKAPHRDRDRAAWRNGSAQR